MNAWKSKVLFLRRLTTDDQDVHGFRTNIGSCIVHQETDIDIADVVFQLTLLVARELPSVLVETKPSCLPLALRLYDYQTKNQGGVPDELTPDEAMNTSTKGSIMADCLQPLAVKTMVRFRAEYMMQNLTQILSGRSEFSNIKLADIISKHKQSFYEIDMLCSKGGADVATVASTYSSAMQSLIKNGSFKVADVTDSASASVTLPTDKTEEKVAAEPTTTSIVECVDGMSIISQGKLNSYGFKKTCQDDPFASKLNSADSLYLLRMSLTAENLAACRTDGLMVGMTGGGVDNNEKKSD